MRSVPKGLEFFPPNFLFVFIFIIFFSKFAQLSNQILKQRRSHQLNQLKMVNSEDPSEKNPSKQDVAFRGKTN